MKSIDTDNYKRVYLYPGEMILVRSPVHLWTLLGSCISIIFHNTSRKLSIMCHAQLPGKASASCKKSCPAHCKRRIIDGDFRYVDCSIRFIHSKLNELKIPKKDIQVSMYGGANVIKTMDSRFKIGTHNIDKAREILKELNIPISKEDVGGNRGRTLTHYSDTGKTTVRLHEKSINFDSLERE